jgi:hypothetical protein
MQLIRLGTLEPDCGIRLSALCPGWDAGEPAGFVDGQQMRVIQLDFDEPTRLWFDPGWTLPDKGLA